MATSITTKMPRMQDEQRDYSGQFSSLDAIVDIDNESQGETEQTLEQRRQQEAEQRVEALKRCLGGWRVAGGVLGVMMVLGWICIIAVLILEEKWQLVLIAWLLLYAAAHFCYWYFKRHSLMSLNSQLRDRLTRLGNGEKINDRPPTYDEVIKSEPPPPTYYSVVEEIPKPMDKLRNVLRSTGAIPKVFKFTSSSKSSANLPYEESYHGKSSGSLAEGSNSLFIVEEHFRAQNTQNSFPLSQPTTSLYESDEGLPPSYDSINFQTMQHISPDQSRRLSTIAVDVDVV